MPTENITFGIITALCADVILSQDCLKRQKQIIIQMNGSQENLVVLNNTTQCTVSASRVEPRPLFQNLLSDCRPIAMKSRYFHEKNKQFIRTEVNKLLKEGITEKSFSSRQAQFLVLRDERHKPRMIVDYSQNVNKYTLHTF